MATLLRANNYEGVQHEEHRRDEKRFGYPPFMGGLRRRPNKHMCASTVGMKSFGARNLRMGKMGAQSLGASTHTQA